MTDIHTTAHIPDEAVQAAETQFTEYFIKNYPKDCIIFNPAWHAPKIFRAAKAAITENTQHLPVPCAVEVPTKEERHANTSRNLIINQTSTDLEQIINGHDPEQSILNNDVWDRLDKMACEIEALTKPVDVTAWAKDLLSIWDQWICCVRSDVAAKEQADLLLRSACFAAQAYEDAISAPITADSAPAVLMRTFFIALIDQNSPDLDPYRAKNRPQTATVTHDGTMPVGVAAVRRQAFEDGFENGVEQSLDALNAYDDITRNEAEQGIRKLKPDYRALSAEPVQGGGE